MSALVVAAIRNGLDHGAYAQRARSLREPYTWLYFVQIGAGGPVKIGVARDPFARVAQLQLANPEPLRIIGVAWSSNQEERQLHQVFSDASIRGEWFRPVAPLIGTAAECLWMYHDDLVRELPQHFTRAEVDELAARDAEILAAEEQDWF